MGSLVEAQRLSRLGEGCSNEWEGSHDSPSIGSGNKEGKAAVGQNQGLGWAWLHRVVAEEGEQHWPQECSSYWAAIKDKYSPPISLLIAKMACL